MSLIMEFKDRFSQLLDAQKVSMYRMSKETGIAQQLVASYKKGAFEPKHENMIILARFFKVSETWLRTGLGDPYAKGKDYQTEEFIASVESGISEVVEKTRKALDEHFDKGTKELTTGQPKKAARPLSKEDRFLQLIESQQRTIESLQRTLESSQQTINVLVNRKGGAAQTEDNAECADVG